MEIPAKTSNEYFTEIDSRYMEKGKKRRIAMYEKIENQIFEKALLIKQKGTLSLPRK